MVDDCSTDGSIEIEESLVKKYPNIRLYQNKNNLGGGATRNIAVEKATGDTIFCLDSDDILPEGTLGKMLNFIEEKECDGVTIHRSIKFNGDNTNDIHRIETCPYLGEKLKLQYLFPVNEDFCSIYVNFMYTKKAFSKAGGYPTTHGYDTQGFAWRFICAGLEARVCPESEYLHRVNFNESYYLREYNNGKINYNWREILLEHYYIFNKKALDFICKFNCQDFTKNILDDLTSLEDILKPNVEEILGQSFPPLATKLSKPKYINRNSLLGYYLRIKKRLTSRH